MKTIEQKAKEYAEVAFAKALKAPWPEAKQGFVDAYLAGAKDALRGQWRSVEDELPEESHEVYDTGVSLSLAKEFLVLVEYNEGIFDHFVAFRKKFRGDSEWTWWDCESIGFVTHWMPIPEPPKPNNHA